MPQETNGCPNFNNSPGFLILQVLQHDAVQGGMGNTIVNQKRKDKMDSGKRPNIY